MAIPENNERKSRLQKLSAKKNKEKVSVAQRAKIRKMRRSAPYTSAVCASKGLTAIRAQAVAVRISPTSLASNPRCVNQSGQNGAITPTTAKKAPK